MLFDSSTFGYVTNRQSISNIFNFYWTPFHVTLDATYPLRTGDRLFMGQTREASRFVSDLYPDRNSALLFMGRAGVTGRRRKTQEHVGPGKTGAGRIFLAGRRIVPVRARVGRRAPAARRNPCHANSLLSPRLDLRRSVCVSGWHANCSVPVRRVAPQRPVRRKGYRGWIARFFVERKSDEFGVDGFIGK